MSGVCEQLTHTLRRSVCLQGGDRLFLHFCDIDYCGSVYELSGETVLELMHLTSCDVHYSPLITCIRCAGTERLTMSTIWQLKLTLACLKGASAHRNFWEPDRTSLIESIIWRPG